MRLKADETVYHYGIAFNLALFSGIVATLIFAIVISLDMPDLRAIILLGFMIFSMTRFLGGFGFFRLNHTDKEIRSKGIVLGKHQIEFLLIEDGESQILAGRETHQSTKHHLTAAYLESQGNIKYVSLYEHNVFSKTLCVGREVATELKVKLIVRSGESDFEIGSDGKKQNISTGFLSNENSQKSKVDSFDVQKSQAAKLLADTITDPEFNADLLKVNTEGEHFKIKYQKKVAMWEIMLTFFASVALLLAVAFVLIVILEKYNEAWIIALSLCSLFLSGWVTIFGIRRCFKARFGVLHITESALSFTGEISKMPSIVNKDLLDISVQSEGLESQSLAITTKSNYIYRFHCRPEVVKVIQRSLALVYEQ